MADWSERLQAALAPRYQLERALGHGGMAEVYLARDLREPSRRRVAIKVLPPEAALAVPSSRFRREVTIAGQLTHPGILPLYESGQVDGFHYYVMPFVAGYSLKERLVCEEKLKVAEAVRIAREVAEALAYAHRQGIVHRDITPANLLFIEDHPIIADFGIARGVDLPKDAEITDKSGVIGTPAYMSPEQVRGSDVDARSDIYSLGCVLYEMLEGHPPFRGDTADAVRASHVADPIPQMTRRGVPAGLRAAIFKALAKSPRDRFPDAAAFARALQFGAAEFAETLSGRWRWRIAAIISPLVLAAGALLAAAIRRGSEADCPTGATLAVLPFANLSRDTANEYLSDGMTSEVIYRLESVRRLCVTPFTTVLAQKGKPADVRATARALGVKYIVEGSVRQELDSLRIIVRLVGANGRRIQSRTFVMDRRTALPKEIAWAIVGWLDVPLRGTETALAGDCTRDELAYDYYLRGRHFWNSRTRASMLRAVEYFRLSIEQDSSYACAYSGLADAYVLAGQYRYLPREEAFPAAKAAAQQTLTLDPTLAEAHTSLAKVCQNYDWDWNCAEREYRRAIELNPRYALARTWFGMFLGRTLARHEEAIHQATVGYQMDRWSPWTNNNFSVVLNHARRYDEAIRYARRAIELAPEWAAAHNQLATAYLWSGRYAEALSEYDAARRLGDGRIRNVTGIVHARTGRRGEAMAVVRELLEEPPGQRRWVELATIYAALGDADGAFEALDNAIATRAFPGEPTLASSPDWDSLRGDPRFAALLRKTGIPP